MSISVRLSNIYLTLLKCLDEAAITNDNDEDDEVNRAVVLPLLGKVKALRAHAYKKAGANELADHLEFHTFVFRCGWMARNLHTAFDYIYNTQKKDSACARVLAGWKIVASNGERLRGYPSITK